jgi:hypothetical protein
MYKCINIDCIGQYLNVVLCCAQDPKKSGHRGFGFVTFADDGAADRVARRTHEILGQEVHSEIFSLMGKRVTKKF